jgi:NADH:ubiquinone oxidoreductase subunit 6 (subunit J)
MNQPTFFFWLLAGITGLCAVSVVVTQNIVRCAAYLLFTLGGTAGVFFLLGADFVGATQLIVYVGGILVLVVFGVMLTAQGPFITMKTSAAEWFISLFVGVLLYGVLWVCIVQAGFPSESDQALMEKAKMEGETRSTIVLGRALLGDKGATPDAKLTGIPKGGLPSSLTTTRQRMSYLLPFEIVSVHLLVVLIGAAYLARAKRRRAST